MQQTIVAVMRLSTGSLSTVQYDCDSSRGYLMKRPCGVFKVSKAHGILRMFSILKNVVVCSCGFEICLGVWMSKDLNALGIKLFISTHRQVCLNLKKGFKRF